MLYTVGWQHDNKKYNQNFGHLAVAIALVSWIVVGRFLLCLTNRTLLDVFP